MKYIKVQWNNEFPEGPILIYSEIDNEQWEHRKIEVFRHERQGYADKTEEVGGSFLGIEPWPDLTKLGTEPEFEISEISADEFEQLWARRGKQR